MKHYISKCLLFVSFQSDAGWEEYYDYIFPSDEVAQPHLKLLEIAKKWKKTQDVPSSENTIDESEN